MTKTTIIVNPDADADDCLAAAVSDYVADHPEAAGYDLDARWADEDERDEILLTVPDWSVAE